MHLRLAPMPLESLLPTKSHPGPGIRLCCGQKTAIGPSATQVLIHKFTRNITYQHLLKPGNTY
jgi:hypothetical protein